MSSKSKEKAEATRDSLSGGSSGGDIGGSVAKCKKDKHWIRILVKDSDGKPAPEIKLTVDVDGSQVNATLDKKGKWDTGKTLDSTADAKITIPALVNCDWWPDGATEPTPAGEKDLAAVGDGDCAERLAHAAGYRSYKNIWDAPENATPKTDRKNANTLLKGDVFKGPDKKDKVETKAVDHEWTFVVRALKKPKLRMVIVDKELKPWSGVKWTLSGLASKKGTTGADGMIEILDIDPNATAGTLRITPPASKTFTNPKPSKSKLPDPPPYPKPVDVAQFEDKDPDRKDLAKDLEFSLKIGFLPPDKDKTGGVARLVNLAFALDDQVKDEDLKWNVKAYQKDILKQKTPSGTLDDIRDNLETRHTKA